MAARWSRAALRLALPAGIAGLVGMLWSRPPERAPEPDSTAEFHFVRVEYTDLPNSRRWFGRGWWMQDWPAAEVHFAQGVRRLTRIDIGENRHLPLTDDRIFDHPWIYATQVGYWDLSGAESDRLGKYLRRGGFLVVDDFHGPRDWEVFRDSMQRVLPGHSILEVDPTDSLTQVLYEIRERSQIPGLRHLRRGPGGTIVVQTPYQPPRWRAVHDERGRMAVAIHFNMDVGDAWEHADMPEYPEAMTSLAYRLGINSIIYAMTH